MGKIYTITNDSRIARPTSRIILLVVPAIIFCIVAVSTFLGLGGWRLIAAMLEPFPHVVYVHYARYTPPLRISSAEPFTLSSDDILDSHAVGSQSMSIREFTAGHTLVGWYTCLTRLESFNPTTTPIDGTVTIHARWQRNTYNITLLNPETYEYIRFTKQFGDTFTFAQLGGHFVYCDTRTLLGFSDTMTGHIFYEHTLVPVTQNMIYYARFMFPPPPPPLAHRPGQGTIIRIRYNVAADAMLIGGAGERMARATSHNTERFYTLQTPFEVVPITFGNRFQRFSHWEWDNQKFRPGQLADIGKLVGSNTDLYEIIFTAIWVWSS